MKKTFILLAVLFSVPLCASTYAGKESLPAVYHLLFSGPATIAGPSLSGTTDTATNLLVTINSDGTGYYLLRLLMEAEPTVAEVLTGTSFAMVANTQAVQSISGLTAVTAYRLYFVAKNTKNKVQSRVQSVAFITSVEIPGMNDTGIIQGGNYPEGNNADCSGEEIGAQDCSHGRDASDNDDSDGFAGFSFTKVDGNGEPLSDQTADYATTPWDCVFDNVTGLAWEVKTDDGGIHDQDDRFTWYNADPATNGGAPGFGDPGDRCFGYVDGNPATFCNTQAYVARVNTAGWCGRSDWRLPTRQELAGIVLHNHEAPVIDPAYFPNSPASIVWTSIVSAKFPRYAWGVDFYLGNSFYYVRDTAFYASQVRLVSGRK